MTLYTDMTRDELNVLKEELLAEYRSFQAKGLNLNMARGKPSAAQLELSLPMMDVLTSKSNFNAEDGSDCRNYGGLEGIPEARRIMAAMLDDKPENVIMGGNSSLSLIYNTFVRFLDLGSLGSRPWRKYDHIEWICPVPGYDRHFAICETFGIKMIPVPLNEDGPDMDEVERLATSDDRIKGIFCIPKYSNPSGISYSDETVRRLASMETAASDFRIIWDNAYCVHHLYDEPERQDHVLDIAHACNEAGNPDRYVKFASTSKVTFAGAGISAFAASPNIIKDVLDVMGIEMIGHDKLNQLRHARFLRDGEGLAEHMSKHAALLRPKFELVLEKLRTQLAPLEIGRWTSPRGGYFITFNAPDGTAKRVVQLAKHAGVVLTGAGATWPYHEDPHDSDIRLAPSLPPLEELDIAMDIFCCSVKLAYVEKLLA